VEEGDRGSPLGDKGRKNVRVFSSSSRNAEKASGNLCPTVFKGLGKRTPGFSLDGENDTKKTPMNSLAAGKALHS